MRGKARKSEPGAPLTAAEMDYRRRLLLFVVLDAAVTFLVLLPGLIYLFVLDNGLSESDMTVYLVGLLVLQGVATGLLIYKFRIHQRP